MAKIYKTIIIPDIHLKHKIIDDFLNNIEYDEAVFLGDYFDDFGDTVLDNVTTARWLKKSLKNKKHIHLMGNHDLPYRVKGKGYLCSGFSTTKCKAINYILNEEDWAKLKSFYYKEIESKSILFTHAGLSSPLYDQSKGDINSFLSDSEEKLKSNFKKQKYEDSWITDIGHRRGGRASFGGVFWCDIHEFKPVDGICQIFGHTIQSNFEPIEIFKNNWCIDTNLKYVMNINDFAEISFEKP